LAILSAATRLRLIAVVFLGSLLIAACGQETTTGGGGGPDTLEPGKLTVGSCLDYKPFEYYKGDQLKGFDVEIVEAIGKELDLDVLWKKAAFPTIFTALAGGKFDMVAAASTITAERKQIVDFSKPYYNSRQGFTVNVKETPDLKSTDDLGNGDIVGVQGGTTGKDWAEQNLTKQGVQIKTFDAAPDAFTDLEAGNIAGIINDEPSSQAEVEERSNLRVVQAIDTGEHYGLALPKDNPDLTSAVNDALQKVIDDGTYAQIFKKYFPGVEVPSEYSS
jgi:ABC-type amino acid transport substrate-binding protein